ncbi:hypothetical protein [Legionella quateirensis]|uniref:Uncharacterized protein n=1 Tax=Legionella quateirensis TaxID=45072 RepID=A0A378KSR2_9GAMM|nr:hypothetical protein [Legionella quateirensis]KTD52842.1 hypothetical protein Lqua_0675 [Legionella quateirensis]STY16428.1 Uncharacterised protein [Legionella quateirensis]
MNLYIKSNSKLLHSFISCFILFLLCYTQIVWSNDHSGWNQSRRYMAHGICQSNHDDMCQGKGVCDTGGAVTQCSSGCSEEPGGWYQYSYYCSQPPADVCSGNAIAKNYAYPKQSCDEYCIGWGVHYCFILDGEFKACSMGNDHGYCMCGTIIGTTPGCTPTPPEPPLSNTP